MYQFCIAVIRNEFSRPKWQPVLSIYRKLDRTLDLLLGLGAVGGILYLIYKYVPILDNKRWTAIVILAGLLVLAAWFLGAVKRFHKSTLVEVYKAQEEMNRQLEASAKRIEFLTLLLGRSDALYMLLDNRRWNDNDNDNAGVAIAKSEVRYHEADIQNTFRERLGSEGVADYFQKLGAVPDNLLAQVERINAHRNKLHGLLQSERAQQLQINQKAIGQKQATL
jgi:hypothetical protein